MRRLILLSVFLFFFLGALPVLAQTGKLSGRITDAGNGAPMAGVTVVLDGTQLGAATDSQGRYTIIGITPGSYTVKVSFIGFATQIIADVRITSNRTKTLDVSIREEAITGEEITVAAERLVVDPNQTTSRALVTGEEINALPVSDLNEVISKTSNSYDGFVRGSRRFETKTLVEGIDVSDAFNLTSVYNISSAGDTKYQVFNTSGDKSMGLFNLNPEAVEEVTVNTGATNASYASGSGGVVAVTLAEGRGGLHGSFSARVAPNLSRPGPDSLDFYHDASIYLDEKSALIASGNATSIDRANLFTWSDGKYDIGGPEMDFRGSLSGAITNNWGFALSGQFFQTNGFMPNQFNKRINGQLKTSYDISKNTQISLVGLFEDNGLWGGWNNTDYSEPFRFYLEGVAQRDGGSYLGSLKLRQVFNESSFLTVQGYRTFNQTRIGYVDDDGNGFQDVGENGDFIDLRETASIEKYIDSGSARSYADGTRKMFGITCDGTVAAMANLNPNYGAGGSNAYYFMACMPYQYDVSSLTNGVKVDYTNQVSFNHLLQLGVDYKTRQFDYLRINGTAGLGFILNGETEPYILSEYTRNPSELGLYISDRMEYADLIVNLGLRMEVIDRDMEKITDYYYPFEETTVNYFGRDVLRRTFRRGESVEKDVFLNPSIGVSHPIGTTASMYFSYARTSQLLPYAQLYRFYDGNNSSDRFNSYPDPEMDPVVSDNFELGIQWEIAEGWGSDINVYTRAIDNYGYVGFTSNERVPTGQTAMNGLNQHTWLTDFGYADARGIEIVLRRAPRNLSENIRLGLTASYTYSAVEQSNATGNNVNLFNSADDTDVSIPFNNAEDFQNFPQSVRGGSSLTGGYDRLHRVIVRGTGNLPAGINVGLLGTFESGFRYPPAIGADPRDRELLTAPSNFNLDLRLEKSFMFGKSAGLSVHVDIKNLTDRQNIVGYNTNEAVQFQELGIPGSRLLNADGSLLYGPARAIYFGTKLTF